MRTLKAPAIIVMLAVLITALAISGCASPTPAATPTPAPTATPTPAPSGPAVLTVDGKVNTPLSLSLNDLKTGYTQASAGWVSNDGKASYNGTGPKLLDILSKAGMQGGATNITFTSGDGFTSSMTVTDLNGKYSDAIVAWDWTGVDKNGNQLTNLNNTLQLIVPAGGNKNQAKMLVQITVS